MSQRFAKELRNELPEVDAFIGLDQVSELGSIVSKSVTQTLNSESLSTMQAIQRRMADNVDLALRRYAPDLHP